MTRSPAKDAQSDRVILSNRFYGTRYLFIAVMAGLVWFMLVNGVGNGIAPYSLLAAGGLYYLVTHTKRALFDEHNLYFVRGGQETAIPLASVTGIKCTGTRVNGSRLWRVEYTERDRTSSTYHFLPRRFWGNPSGFVETARAANPKLVYWSHPYFFHETPDADDAGRDS
ncbi:MAG: hypothetical protein CVT73_11510 [Alphaproteobacteria bacterium HGW-Alphaproteobacteria-12]|nr:MAG: hypothetical protein CVT73_11510 [Alphaproteobacteria bacterium HGW-Alphaproteobacteria-12]